MVDIAAQLSLTASGPAIDPTAILGAETADSQAFGDILAGQVTGRAQAKADTGAPATPLPPFPAPAGNRQPGGKILPGAAQILPDAAPLGLQAPAPQVLPSMAVVPSLRLVTTPSPTKLVPQPHTPADGAATDPAAEASAPKQGEVSPVHGLIKMLTAALKGQRPAAPRGAEGAPAPAETADPEAAGAEPEMAKQAIPAAPPTLAALTVTQPILPAIAAPQSEAARAAPGSALPIPARTLMLITTPSRPQQADAVLREEIQPALAQFLAQPPETRLVQTQPAQTLAVSTLAVSTPAVSAQLAQVPPAQVQPVQASEGASSAAPALPVLTVAAPGQGPAPVVTLVAAPTLPVGPTVAARVEVAPSAHDQSGPAVTADRAAAGQPPLAGRDLAAEAPVAAGRVAPAIRAVLAERVAADRSAVPAAAEAQAPLSVAVPVTPAPAAPVTNPGAPVVEMPRQDFAALVDRLVEARNAAVSQSTHASLNHAEFGQVSLHFQQDGGDLKVAMSSADPDFARAAQAAQAAQPAMPAERQNFADSNPRGQGQSQNQSPANGSSQSHHDAAGRDAGRSDQQSRNGQGRNPRGGDNSSNPSPRWAGRDQPQSRGGIFA